MFVKQEKPVGEMPTPCAMKQVRKSSLEQYCENCRLNYLIETKSETQGAGWRCDDVVKEDKLSIMETIEGKKDKV